MGPVEFDEVMFEATEDTIFSQYGTVTSVKTLPVQPGKADTAALVRMADVEQAKWLVVNVHGNIPSGLSEPVTINYAERKGSRDPTMGAMGAMGTMGTMESPQMLALANAG